MRHTVYGVFAFLVLGILVLSATAFGRRVSQSFFSPFTSLWRSGERWVAGILPDWLPGTKSKQERLLELELKVRELETRLARSVELEKANAELRRLYQLPDLPAWKAVAADVISRDPIRWNQEFGINKGLMEGIQVGALVMSGPYVVGRVRESNRHSAQIATLISPECRFSVVLGEQKTVGICSGSESRGLRGEAQFQVDFLPKDLRLHHGQEVFTSGLGGGIPGGLPVGIVVPCGDGKLFQIVANSRAKLLCEPLGNLPAIRYVVVLCPVWKTDE
ncbi:MAG: rod shape-determining protein MreC [Lentisphaeria bacterium]